jgi:lysozyme
MKTSQRGINLIKQFEGVRLTAYKCPAGVYTIGYGHTRGVKRGMKITEEEASAYLTADLLNSERAVERYDSVYHWNQNEFDALVSFTFNCGATNLRSLLRNGRRNREQIAAILPLYRKAGGKVLKGLERRRAAEKTLFLERV